MEKYFPEWIQLKEKLHRKNIITPYVREGDLWWVSLGENIGEEINGKSWKFSRPVIIFKKLSRTLYLVIPLTSQPKEGTWFPKITQQTKAMWACLHHIRTIDHRRLWSKIGQLNHTDLRLVKTMFRRLYH